MNRVLALHAGSDAPARRHRLRWALSRLSLGLALSAAMRAAPARSEGSPLEGAPGLTRSATVTTGRVLTLEEALTTASKLQPQLRSASAQRAAASARRAEARAGYLPRVDAQAQYQRSTANFPISPAFSRSALAAMPRENTLDTVNYYQFGITAQETIYDFGRTGGAVDAAEANERASAAELATVERGVALGVRLNYFGVLASKALVAVGEQTAQNQKKHVHQIEQFVAAGTRPKIDLTSARLNLANVELALIRARNGLALAKVALNGAMGVEGPIDYDVVLPEEAFGADMEDDLEVMIEEAVRRRPEVARIDSRILAAESQASALRGGYYPALVASAAFNGATVGSIPFGLNGYLGVGLSWNLFAGFATQSQVQALEANVSALTADRDALRISIRSELETQRLTVDEAKRRFDVAERAVAAAEERLQLAEGRYQAGASDVLELDDAQVTDANAKTQRVQALYDLAIARARLRHALGSDER